MTDEMVAALLDMYETLGLATESQRLRDSTDQKERSKVTSGKHMARIVDVILSDLIDRGYDADDLLYRKGSLVLPGYFRAAKRWDVLCFDGEALMAAIELKSINSSFGNNQNNRTEEAIGDAVDLDYALAKGLIPRYARPPARCYVMVVCDCPGTRSLVRKQHAVHFEVDPVFEDTSYQERFEIMCRRFLEERLYEAVWLVYVDAENGQVREPSPALSYSAFIETITAQLRIHRAGL